jgi:hypothetical protein
LYVWKKKNVSKAEILHNANDHEFLHPISFTKIQQRHLWIFGNPEISIENILDDTLFTEPNIELDVEVKYGKASFFSFFSKLSGVEILVDSKVVAKRSSFLGLPKIFGNDTFKLDLTNFDDGAHTIQARGYKGFRIFGQSVVSPAIPFTIDRSLCNPSKSFIVFLGQNDVTSIMRGQVNITWSPGFVAVMEDVSLIWCGEFTYDVFVVEGDFDFSAANVTGPELIELADKDGTVNRYETSNLTLVVSNLQPGSNYSFLVMAKTETGHYSDNRDGATIEISSFDVKVKSDFTRLVNIPESTSLFQVVNNMTDTTVSFSGELPIEVLTLQSMDFIFFFDMNGNATLGRCINKIESDLGSSSVAWKYQLSEFSDIFDELDLSTEYADETLVEELDEYDTEDFDDFDPDEYAMYERLNQNVKRNLCIYAFPGSDGTKCEEEVVDGRMLLFGRLKRRVKRAFRRVKRVAKKTVKGFVSAAKFIGKKITDFVKREYTFARTRTLLDVDRSARLTTSDSGLEIGLEYDILAKAKLRITVSLAKAINRASINVYGGFTLETYLNLLASTPRRYQPPPLLVFDKRGRKIVAIGPLPPPIPVPVIFLWIVSKPKVYATVEIVTATEGEAGVVMKFGYDYTFEYSYDKSRSEKFQKKTSFVPSPQLLDDDPKYNLRLIAYAELGAIVNWDIFVNSILQGSAAIDIGFRPELQIGTNADAFAVTFPYILTLDKLAVYMFIRARILVGLNNDVVRIFRKLAVPPIINQFITFKTTRTYNVPDLVLGSNVTPSPLRLAFDLARNSPLYENATFISLAQLNALVPDPFPETIGTPIQSLDLTFGLKWEVFNDEFFILGAPKIGLSRAGIPQLCQGGDAIVLTVKTDITKAVMPFRNDLLGVQWYANFDGFLFRENTAWVLDPVRTNKDSITMRLPRSARSRSDFTYFQINNNASIILRATPQILPFPERSIFVKANLQTLFPVTKFECCDNSECGFSSYCSNRLCYPTVI